jgi:nicotinamide-nucleotide amidase
MNAEIISIGDELLIGQVVNTNASFISRELNAIGVGVARVTTIGDEMKPILATFKRAWKEQDVVIVTGGLGPTHDDISKAAVAKFFEKKLILHKPTLRAVEARFKRFGYRKMPEVNIGQAMIPEGFVALKNEKGTAPGLLYHEDGKTFVIMAGVPFEMEFLLTTHVLPFLKKTYRTNLEIIRHRTILTTGIGESLLAEKIGDMNTLLSDGLTLAFLPRNGSVRLRITARGTDRSLVDKQIRGLERHIRARASEWIYGVENETLEANIVALLKEQASTLSTAESCTGGLIATKITEVPGSSDVFIGSVVAYDNAIKERELGVRRQTLRKHGAVSEETAVEMAEGIRAKYRTRYALSVTGIAGPGGGSEEKPVGLIWLALAEKGKPVETRKLQLAFDRSINRERAANAALEMLRKRILTSA